MTTNGLSNTECRDAQIKIDAKASGQYELAEIYGPDWTNISDPTSFGRRFKCSVGSRHLNGICWDHQNVQNHEVYKITKETSNESHTN